MTSQDLEMKHMKPIETHGLVGNLHISGTIQNGGCPRCDRLHTELMSLVRSSRRSRILQGLCRWRMSTLEITRPGFFLMPKSENLRLKITKNATTNPQAQASSAGKLQKRKIAEKKPSRVEMMFVESFPVSNSKCLSTYLFWGGWHLWTAMLFLRPSYIQTSAVEVAESASVSNSCQRLQMCGNGCVWKWRSYPASHG